MVSPSAQTAQLLLLLTGAAGTREPLETCCHQMDCYRVSVDQFKGKCVAAGIAVSFYPAHTTPAALLLSRLGITASQQILFSLAAKIPWTWPGSASCPLPLQGHGDSRGPRSFLLAHQKMPAKSFGSSGSAASAALGASALHTH